MLLQAEGNLNGLIVIITIFKWITVFYYHFLINLPIRLG